MTNIEIKKEIKQAKDLNFLLKTTEKTVIVFNKINKINQEKLSLFFKKNKKNFNKNETKIKDIDIDLLQCDTDWKNDPDDEAISWETYWIKLFYDEKRDQFAFTFQGDGVDEADEDDNIKKHTYYANSINGIYNFLINIHNHHTEYWGF